MPAMWSEWPCVRTKRSSLSTPSLRHWSRNSGAASTWMWSPSMTTWMDALVRLLRGSADRQTGQPHPIIGTPWDVPLPRTITSILVRTHDCPAPAPWHQKKAPWPHGRGALNQFFRDRSIVHPAARRMGGGRILLLGDLGDHALGREQEPSDRSRVLQRRACHLGR